MRYLIIAVAVIMAVTGFAGTANSGVKNQYSHAYYSAVQRCGSKDAAGRNIRRYNLPNGKKAHRKHYLRSMQTLDRLCRPLPKPAPAPTQAPTTQAPTQAPTHAPTSYSGGGGGCSGMSAESGKLGYNNNTHAGYIGCYQISADHYSSGGSCSGLGTDPHGQDQCAAIICHTEGAGAWTNPQGQNPCARLGVR